MAFVLVVGATLQCTHGGVARLTSGSNELQVDGKAVIAQGQEVGISFAPGPGVITPCPWVSGGVTSPCTATLTATGGISAKVQVNNKGVLLDNASGPATNAASTSQWSVMDAGQNKLEADG